jgi:hypothetical protein
VRCTRTGEVAGVPAIGPDDEIASVIRHTAPSAAVGIRPRRWCIAPRPRVGPSGDRAHGLARARRPAVGAPSATPCDPSGRHASC